MKKNETKKANSYNTGIVIVRLKIQFLVPSAETLEEVIKEFDLKDLWETYQKFNIKKSERTVTALSYERIAELEKNAMETDFPPLYSLNSYWKLDARHLIEKKGDNNKVNELIDELLQASSVEAAYEYTSTTQPGAVIPRSGDVTTGFIPDQGYLNAADQGVDAKFAWACGFDGSAPALAMNVNTLIDVEDGWNLSHEDLPVTVPAVPPNEINPETVDETFPGGIVIRINHHINHGTAVLGIIAAKDNDFGVLGVAPGVDQIKPLSHYTGVKTDLSTIYDAIAKAVDMGLAGDILLIECQMGGVYPLVDSMGRTVDSLQCWPIECETEIFHGSTVFNLFRLAASRGIIVIEPAGNGNDYFMNDLDSIMPPFIPGDENDSGAIMVAACYDDVPHERLERTYDYVDTIIRYFTNYGSRVNCFAWGHNVATCGYDDILEDMPGYDINKQYNLKFALTSAASAIIAGVALVVQGIAKEVLSRPLTPLEMRSLLSDPDFGTLSKNSTAADPNADKIGVMPDLRKIILDHFGIAPDVFMRDNFSDDGSVPSGGTASESPDILIQSISSADPESDFISGTNYDLFTTSSFVPNDRDNYIYVRHKNRGNRDLNNLQTTVYYSRAATLITPSSWTEIGTVNTPVIMQGMAAVSDELVWNQADIPATGHYCFIAISDSLLDPAPAIPASIFSFYDFVIQNNNVAWRNFDVILLPAASSKRIMEFFVGGFPKGKFPFQFQFKKNIIKALDLSLEIPVEFAKLLFPKVKFFSEVSKGYISLPINAEINLIFKNVLLPPNKNYLFRMVVNYDSKKIPPFIINAGSLRVTQLFKGKIMGGISLKFVKTMKPSLTTNLDEIM